MGIGSILRAARIILVAMGERKAECVERVVHGPVTTRLPASLLQVHREVEILLDRFAKAQPWVEECLAANPPADIRDLVQAMNEEIADAIAP